MKYLVGQCRRMGKFEYCIRKCGGGILEMEGENCPGGLVWTNAVQKNNPSDQPSAVNGGVGNL